MTFPNGLKRICDICAYMTFASLIASFLGSDNLIITLPVFASVAFLSAFLAPRGKIKYMGIIPLFLIFLITPSTLINLVVFIPTIAYMIWAIPKPDESLSGFNYEPIFNGFIKIVGTILLLRLIFGVMFDGEPIPTDSLLFATAFLLLATLFTRMIRHDDDILNDIRFKLINIISVIGIILGTFFVTNRMFLETGVTIYLFIARYLTHLLILITYPFARLLSFLLPEADPAAMELNWITELIGNMEPLEHNEAGSPILGSIIGIIAFSVIVIVVLSLFFKLIKEILNKILGSQREDDIEDEIIPLDENDKKKRRFRRRENQIRELYRKFLKLIKMNDIDTSLHLTSKEIETQVVNTFNTETSGTFRDEYIQIRYKEDEFTKNDVKRMKELYKSVKEEIETFS